MPPTALVLLSAGVILCGCDQAAPPVTHAEPPPVVKIPPVQTRPFEEGYEVGFASGKAAGRPRAKLPETEELEAKASQEAGADPQRAAKWQRGWVAGYVDGFLKASGGLK